MLTSALWVVSLAGAMPWSAVILAPFAITVLNLVLAPFANAVRERDWRRKPWKHRSGDRAAEPAADGRRAGLDADHRGRVGYT